MKGLKLKVFVSAFVILLPIYTEGEMIRNPRILS
jgi:hypothetical protein